MGKYFCSSLEWCPWFQIQIDDKMRGQYHCLFAHVNKFHSPPYLFRRLEEHATIIYCQYGVYDSLLKLLLDRRAQQCQEEIHEVNHMENQPNVMMYNFFISVVAPWCNSTGSTRQQIALTIYPSKYPVSIIIHPMMEIRFFNSYHKTKTHWKRGQCHHKIL